MILHPTTWLRGVSLVLLFLMWNFLRGDATCTKYASPIQIIRNEPLIGNFYNFTEAVNTTLIMSTNADFSFDPVSRMVYANKSFGPGTKVVNFICRMTGQLGKQIMLVVVIMDVNNVMPGWVVGTIEKNASSVSVTEGPSSKGTILPVESSTQKPFCNGNDAPDVTLTNLEILNGTDSDKVSLKTSSGGNILSIKLETELDYEVTPKIVLTVRCYDRDAATKRLVGTADFEFTINVENVVEKGSYKFEHSLYTVSLRANASEGTILNTEPAAINATNNEAETPVYPEYAMSFIEPSVQSYFSINSSNGEIELIKDNPPPRADPYKIRLTVGIRDDPSAAKGQTSVDISVLPAIDVPPHFVPQSLRPKSFPETSSSSVTIATIRAAYSRIAGPTPSTRKITFTILTYNETFGFFGCTKDSCDLRSIRKLDYEKNDRIFVVQMAIYDNVTTSVTGSIMINVTDANDNLPMFLKDKYVFRDIPKIANQNIGTVKAIDNDINTDIRYSINHTADFRIDPVRGNISFNTDPNKLTDTSYSFTVKASDGSNYGVTVVTVYLITTIVSSANVMLPAVASLGGAVGLILIVAIICFCYLRRKGKTFSYNAKKRRADQLDKTNPQPMDSHYMYGMTTVQENPICTDIYGEEDGLDMEMYKGDRSVGEIQLTDTGGVGVNSPIGGSIRTTMSGSTNSFYPNPQPHLIPNGNALKLSANSMELVTADNAVNGGPIDLSQQDGKDEMTIYF